jgi:fructokinase
MSKPVVSFGELLWDVLPAGPELGGAPSNFAYRMQSLGLEAIIVSRVGKDELGKAALAALREKKLRTDFIQVDPNRATGTVNVQVSAAGEPDFEIVPNVAYDFIEFTPELAELAARAECVCFGTLIQRSERSRATLYKLLDVARSAKKVLDLNLRKNCYTPETIRESLVRTDILKLNESELFALAALLNIEEPELEKHETQADELRYLAVNLAHIFELELCIVTRGAEGSMALKFEHAYDASSSTHTAQAVEHPSFPVEVQDTCGSGDAFTAAFIHQYLEGKPIDICSAWGNALGALVAARRGGMAPVPMDEIQRLLRPAS